MSVFHLMCHIEINTQPHKFSKVNYWNIDFPQILFKFQLHLVPEN